VSPAKRPSHRKRKTVKHPKAPEGERWEEVSRRIPLGERLPNPEIVTEEELARTPEAEETREPSVTELYEPSEEDGA